ncbi:MAG: SusD/RagB family nutrient-binding outer membrane lipoprotein [Saprospiraceae bacterium]|nr:SusD/RagB family nutrient-binding outer membrane lipoprotein [Saprospiraceae bacterium]
MKNLKVWLLILIVGFSNACTKDFEEINTNPNQAEEVPLTNVLLSAVTQGVRRTHGASMNMTYAGLWAQHYAKIQYIDEDWYEYRSDALTAHWDGLYGGPLADLQDILNRAPETSNMRAAALTMKSFYFGIITDAWGEAPYSEALDPDRTVNPTYDSQETIYAGIISDLEAASAMWGVSSDPLGAGDVIYGGDVTLWKKFTNSLLARYLNRAKHKNPAYATKLAALLSNPGNLIASNAENALMTYPDATPAGSNPLYNNKYNDGRNDHAVSKTLVDLMAGDPRLPVYAEVNNAGIYVGQPNGTVEPNPFSAVSQIGAKFRDDFAAPSYLFTYAEVLFIRAEAENFKPAYLAGIEASCEQHGVTADQAFLDAASAAYDANPLQAIMTQKWIALFGDGCEGYAEFRRTGYPSEIVEVPLSAYPGQGVPKRFAYPTSESGNNKVNLEAAIQRQNIDPSGIYGNDMWWKL